jgi:hypothetical protein
VSLKLSPGEQVIFEGHPSWRAILGFYLRGLFVTLVVGAIVGAIAIAFVGIWVLGAATLVYLVVAALRALT